MQYSRCEGRGKAQGYVQEHEQGTKKSQSSAGAHVLNGMDKKNIEYLTSNRSRQPVPRM